MFTLLARKAAIVAILGAGSVLSAGAFAAQAASTPPADDVVRPASVTTTYDDMPDLRGDGTLEDYGIDDGLSGDDTLDDDGALDVDDDYLDDDGLEDDGVEDEGIDDDGTDDVVVPAPSPVELPTDADHSHGDDSAHENSVDDDESDDDSDDDADDDDDASDDSDDSGYDD